MPFSVAAQQPDTLVDPALLQQVLPRADSISGRQGTPPVYRAYRTDTASRAKVLVGYGFLTSDWPPEERGYGGPIRVLVGIDLAGTITGARVLSYWEPIRAELGDFLHEPGVQEQYQGKHISDPFQLYADIRGISRATITVAAMARTIQASARHVAIALSPTALFGVAPGGTPEPASTRRRLEEMSWADMAKIGMVKRIDVSGRGASGFEFTFTYLGDEWFGPAVAGG